jgi:cell division protein FtsZ
VGISEIIIRPGLINVDFADVRTIMGDAGTALMGIGRYASHLSHYCAFLL